MRFLSIKNTLAGFMFLFSISAIACPYLTGTYKRCFQMRGSSWREDLIITEGVDNNVKYYNLSWIPVNDFDGAGTRTSDKLIADGQTRIVPRAGRSPYRVKVSCARNTLIEVTSDSNGLNAWETRYYFEGKKLIISSKAVAGSTDVYSQECE